MVWSSILLPALGLWILVLHLLGYRHAYRMTHFRKSPDSPEAEEGIPLWKRWMRSLLGVEPIRPQSVQTPADHRLSYRLHTMPSDGGILLEGWEIPSTSPDWIVLLPPFGHTKGDLLEEAAIFHSWGWSLFLIDFRGHGGSTGNACALGSQEAEDVEATLVYLRRTFSPEHVVLYGISLGAVAAMRAIARGAAQRASQPVAGLILEGPFDTLLGTVRNRLQDLGLPPIGLAELLVFWGGTIHGFNGFRHSPREDAAAISVPTLLFHGGADTRVTVAQASSIANALPSLYAFHVIERARHGEVFPTSPAEWMRETQAFLEDVRRGEFRK